VEQMAFVDSRRVLATQEMSAEGTNSQARFFFPPPMGHRRQTQLR
jgi:hypothetical protein